MSALGLFGTITPSADASGADVMALQGTAIVSGGLSFPCQGAGMPDPTKCSALSVSCGGDHAACVTGGNTRAMIFSSDVCAGGAITDGVSVGALTCSLTAAGIVTGSCGLSSGLGTWNRHVKEEGVFQLSPLKILYLLVRWESGNYHYTMAGKLLVLTGSTATGTTLVGVLTVTPIPEVAGSTVGNSCAAKTADTFTVSGVVTVSTS